MLVLPLTQLSGILGVFGSILWDLGGEQA